MAFEEFKENTQDIQKEAEIYIKKSLAYYKLWGFKVAMQSTTLLLKFILIALTIMMFMFFFSVAGALAIGQMLNNYALGFLIVAGIFLLITGILFLVKDKIIEGPILERFSEIFFKD